MFRLIALFLTALALAACGAQPAQPGTTTSPANVTGVEVSVRESLPVQVEAHITGQLGDGCMSLGPITQTRSGNLIEVSVPAIRTQAEICTMVMQLIDERVTLEGEFAPGEYTVRVNGVETSFTV
jgi:hypothetical protein